MAITLKDNPAEDKQDVAAVARSRARDDFQKNIDGTVGGMVTEWKANGSPAPTVDDNGLAHLSPGMPTYRYTITKDERNAMKGVVRRAAHLHKVGVFWLKDWER